MLREGDRSVRKGTVLLHMYGGGPLASAHWLLQKKNPLPMAHDLSGNTGVCRRQQQRGKNPWEGAKRNNPKSRGRSG